MKTNVAGAEPSFSICIPNYNYGHYIGDTIQSVLDQSYQNFEIIVADNASTDNSIEVVRRLQETDSRIRLVHNQYNIGFAPNLQRVTMEAKNEFINLLSSDDQMKPNALATYANILMQLGEKRSNAVLFSQVEKFDDQNRITGWVRKASEGFFNTHISQRDEHVHTDTNASDVVYEQYEGIKVLTDSLKRLRPFAPFLTVVYARALWQAIEGYNSIRTVGPDKHFNYKLLGQNPTVIYVEEVLYRYRDFTSANRSSLVTTLKQPIDDYLYTLEYRDPFLRSIGLSHEQLLTTFIRRSCINNGLTQFAHRNYQQAFRLLSFAVASYPGVAIRYTKTYILLGLLLTSPLSWLLSPILYRLYKRLSDNTSTYGLPI